METKQLKIHIDNFQSVFDIVSTYREKESYLLLAYMTSSINKTIYL